MTLPVLLAHVAARWAATRTPTCGWVPDESEIEMTEHEPMAQERLDAIQERLDCGTPTTDDVSALLAEVERLRARLTVDDAMVERAAGTLFKQDFLERNPWADGARAQRSLEQARASTPRAWGQYLQVVRAALNAALGTGEDA